VEFIVFSLQKFFMLKHKALYLSHFDRRNVDTSRQGYRIEPKFALAFADFTVDMCGLIAVIQAEVKTVRADSQHSRHRID